MKTCKVRLFLPAIPLRRGRGTATPLCGQPIVARGLCEKHFADRLRLGGV